MSASSRKSVRFVDPDPSPPQQVREAKADPGDTTTTTTALPNSREATGSQNTRGTSEALNLCLEEDTDAEPVVHRSASVTFSLTQPKESSNSEPQESQEKTPPPPVSTPPSSQQQAKHSEELLDTDNSKTKVGSYRIETRNFLTRNGAVQKPHNPFQDKVVTVYAVSPLADLGLKKQKQRTESIAYYLDSGSVKPAKSVTVQNADPGELTASKNAYVVVDVQNFRKVKVPGKGAESVYIKVQPGCQKYRVPIKASSSGSSSLYSHSSSKNPYSSAGVSIPQRRTQSANPAVSSPARKISGTEMSMSCHTGMDIYNPVSQSTLSRSQEKEELQHLNDRFSAYVQRVRMLAEKNNQLDSTAIIKTTKILEQEIHNLKNLYEQELDKLRKELEACNHERTTHQVQLNKQLQYSSEIQDRLNIETDKNGRLLDDMNNYQRRIGILEGEIHDMRIASGRPQSDVEQLQRTVENLTRENETWKHRYEQEQVARQESETRIQQLVHKSEFDDKVHMEQISELHSRIETSAATILSLEAKVRELSKADVSVSELLKQVRDTAEAELRKYQMESDDQYNRNLTAMKGQLDSDAKTIEMLETERSQLRGSIGELQARIRNLEGQVANLEHQKQTLEDAVTVERNRAADSARQLERKLREVQELLVTKMREVTTAREMNVPLKAEIEALKALLEEEEKRLRVPLGVMAPASTEPTSFVNAYNITSTTNTAAIPSAPPLSSSGDAIATSYKPHVSYQHGSTAHQPASTAYQPASSTVYQQASSTSYQQAASSSYQPAGSYQPTYAPVPGSPYSPYVPVSTSYPDVTPMPLNYTSTLPTVSFAGDTRPYVPSPPLSVTYIPGELQTNEASTMYDGLFSAPAYAGDMSDPSMYGYMGTMPLAKYSYETSPALNKLTVEPSPPNTPRTVGPVRAKSAPVERQRNLGLVPVNLGQGHDYFDKMFQDLHRDTLYSKSSRPKSSPQRTDRPLSSLYHDYTVSTSSTKHVKMEEGTLQHSRNQKIEELLAKLDEFELQLPKHMRCKKGGYCPNPRCRKSAKCCCKF